MNYHFTTTKAHIELAGATVLDCTAPMRWTRKALPFKGNMDRDRLKAAIAKAGRKTSVRPHGATTNLIGGQTVLMLNLRDHQGITERSASPGCRWQHDLRERLIIHQREAGYENTSSRHHREMMSILRSLLHLRRRVTACAAASSPPTARISTKPSGPGCRSHEGFFTDGGMSSKEIEAMAIGVRE